MGIRKRSVVELDFIIEPIASDMDEREPCDPKKCKWKIAGARSASFALGGVTKGNIVTKFWVDAGHIRFSFGGYRWQADTPKAIKADLIALDKWDRSPPEVKASKKAPNYMGKVKVKARRMSKIVKASPQLLRSMKDRRAKRLERGQKDKVYPKKTLHQRVVGFA